MISNSIRFNREQFLSILRTDKYEKGIATSDERGNPIVEKEGYCVCAIMVHEFGPSYKDAREALGLSGKDCTYIQRELNDTNLSFIEIADILEQNNFKRCLS